MLAQTAWACSEAVCTPPPATRVHGFRAVVCVGGEGKGDGGGCTYVCVCMCVYVCVCVCVCIYVYWHELGRHSLEAPSTPAASFFTYQVI